MPAMTANTRRPRVLIACEESQSVASLMRRRGIEAYSCDLLPTSGNHPEYHIQADALEVAKMDWDAVIAFPPCTHLAVSGAAWFDKKQRDGRQQMGIGFFLAFTALDHVPFVAIENPVGIMSNIYRKPDQIINPYQFGDPYEKKTCLWLKGLPLLESTDIVEPNPRIYYESGKSDPDWHTETRGLKGHERSKARSKTFPGIAKAMASQWGGTSRRQLMNNIKVQLDEGAYMPERAYAWDAGADLRTPIALTIHAGNSIVVDTGVHMEIPEGYVGMLKSKSGLNVNHRMTTVGVIDAGYTGSIKVRIYNHGPKHRFEAGDKITQIVIMPVETPDFEQVDEISGGERGDSGYGSTGR